MAGNENLFLTGAVPPVFELLREGRLVEAVVARYLWLLDEVFACAEAKRAAEGAEADAEAVACFAWRVCLEKEFGTHQLWPCGNKLTECDRQVLAKVDRLKKVYLDAVNTLGLLQQRVTA
mmetsp:Transcript_7601/g.21660  ORF Transcript_7601/g.21660 Transcript_7601/m.21660 type:complete len:120 (+) Transcript_7601:1236-1595(+)